MQHALPALRQPDRSRSSGGGRDLARTLPCPSTLSRHVMPMMHHRATQMTEHEPKYRHEHILYGWCHAPHHAIEKILTRVLRKRKRPPPPNESGGGLDDLSGLLLSSRASRQIRLSLRGKVASPATCLQFLPPAGRLSGLQVLLLSHVLLLQVLRLLLVALLHLLPLRVARFSFIRL